MLISQLPRTEQPLRRLEQVGADALSIRELLAVIAGGDNGLEIADALLLSVDEVWQITNRHPHDLMQLRGVGESTANRIVAAVELGLRLSTADNKKSERVSSPGDAYDYFSRLMHREQEELWVLYLNTRNAVISEQRLYLGTMNSTAVRPAEIYRSAVVRNAAAIIIAHNHPSGDVSPSPDDIRITRELAKSGTSLDITLIDHLIIGRGQRFYSMKERNPEVF